MLIPQIKIVLIYILRLFFRIIHIKSYILSILFLIVFHWEQIFEENYGKQHYDSNEQNELPILIGMQKLPKGFKIPK